MWHYFFCVMGKSEEHQVAVREENGRLTISCDCTAGSYGKNCRHKLALLSDDPDMLELFGAEDLKAYNHLVDMLAGSEERELAREFRELSAYL